MATLEAGTPQIFGDATDADVEAARKLIKPDETILAVLRNPECEITKAFLQPAACFCIPPLGPLTTVMVMIGAIPSVDIGCVPLVGVGNSMCVSGRRAKLKRELFIFTDKRVYTLPVDRNTGELYKDTSQFDDPRLAGGSEILGNVLHVAVGHVVDHEGCGGPGAYCFGCGVGRVEVFLPPGSDACTSVNKSGSINRHPRTKDFAHLQGLNVMDIMSDQPKVVAAFIEKLRVEIGEPQAQKMERDSSTGFLHAPEGADVVVAGAVVNDPLEEISKLKKLLDGGVLTEEEFQAKKTELLARV